MPHDDPDDDEDWYDADGDEADEPEFGQCPECGRPVHSVSDKCPACGYWLSDADRRAMWAGASRPAWQKITALVLLAVFLAGLLATMGLF